MRIAATSGGAYIHVGLTRQHTVGSTPGYAALSGARGTRLAATCSSVRRPCRARTGVPRLQILPCERIDWCAPVEFVLDVVSVDLRLDVYWQALLRTDQIDRSAPLPPSGLKLWP